VATRYDKREYVYRGTANVASIRIWLKDPVPDPQDRPYRTGPTGQALGESAESRVTRPGWAGQAELATG
jgi:hypothetical protein